MDALLMRRRMMIGSGSGPTPVLPYDAEVEYLQGDGLSYIDTGINLRVVSVATLSFMFPTVPSGICVLFGAHYDNASIPRNQAAYVNNGKWSSTDTTYTTTTGVTYNANVSANTAYDITVTQKNAQASDVTMYVFARNNDTGSYLPSPMRLYSLKITQNGVVVRDFIPVRKGQVGYLYDKVTNTLFGNIGSGSFSYGQDISTSPVFYNYIYFDGTAYISTNYVLPENCSIRVSLGMETNHVSQQVLGANGSNGGYIVVYYGGATNTTRRQVVVDYDSSSYVKTQNLNWTYASFGFFLTPSRMGWGDSAYTFTKGNLHPDGALHFGVNNPQSSVAKYSGRFTQIRIYGSDASGVTTEAGFDNYTPVATFRPCTYNNVPGLWYVEGNTFFGNSAGAGTLTVSDS